MQKLLMDIVPKRKLAILKMDVVKWMKGVGTVLVKKCAAEEGTAGTLSLALGAGKTAAGRRNACQPGSIRRAPNTPK